MKTKTQPHEPLSELREFVATQAAEDAVLPASERLYQADLVKDVIKQEPLKPKIIKELVDSYSTAVARCLNAKRQTALKLV